MGREMEGIELITTSPVMGVSEVLTLGDAATATSTASSVSRVVGATDVIQRVGPVAQETLAPWALPKNPVGVGQPGSPGGFQPWFTPYQPELRSPQPNQNPELEQSSQKQPQTNPNPQRQFDPYEKPTKEGDEEGYYIYETGSTDKIVSGMVDKSAGKLPYFGITKNAVVASTGTNGRYAASNPRAKNLSAYRGILGKADYFTAAGVEAALVALNTYGKNFEKKVLANQHSSTDVKKSTRVDNKMFSNKDREMIKKGISWLRSNYGKSWKKDFLHKENKKGKNNTTP